MHMLHYNTSPVLQLYSISHTRALFVFMYVVHVHVCMVHMVHVCNPCMYVWVYICMFTPYNEYLLRPEC